MPPTIAHAGQTSRCWPSRTAVGRTDQRVVKLEVCWDVQHRRRASMARRLPCHLLRGVLGNWIVTREVPTTQSFKLSWTARMHFFECGCCGRSSTELMRPTRWTPSLDNEQVTALKKQRVSWRWIRRAASMQYTVQNLRTWD